MFCGDLGSGPIWLLQANGDQTEALSVNCSPFDVTFVGLGGTFVCAAASDDLNIEVTA
jgi:hypothetical protein